MSSNSCQVRVGIQVTRQEEGGGWPLFEYRMFWCKQRAIPTNPRVVPDADWAQESIGMLGVMGGVPGEHKMKFGESRRYWATIYIRAWSDYWGEWDEDLEFVKIKRAK